METTVRTVPKAAGNETRIETHKEVLLHGSAYYGMIGLVLIQLILVTMVYGPIAAFLVELFPTRIRYTSMSLPYHIGNGVFGGLTPFIATSLYEFSKTPAQPAGDPFAGLFYPITIAGLTFTRSYSRGLQRSVLLSQFKDVRNKGGRSQIARYITRTDHCSPSMHGT